MELQAALYKPENFDPSKKYPMMIYIYERLTQNVHNFVRPAPGTSINIAYYVSNGYLVLTPDIVYTTGHPGQSALKCVLPAIQAVVDKGLRESRRDRHSGTQLGRLSDRVYADANQRCSTRRKRARRWRT